MAGSEWLEKKFIEKMLTEHLFDEDVRLLRLLDFITYSLHVFVKMPSDVACFTSLSFHG